MPTLRKAIHDDDLNQLKQLLDLSSGSSPDEVDKALLYAVDRGHDGAVAQLLSHGARTELAFLGATRSQSPAVFQEFINHGWDINLMKFRVPALRSAVCSCLNL